MRVGQEGRHAKKKGSRLAEEREGSSDVPDNHAATEKGRDKG